jgi:transposase InsO family protein
MDFMQNLPTTKNGNNHIITAIDHATRWVVARAVPDMNSHTVLKFLYEDIMAPYEILTDRGSSFLSAPLKEFEEIQRIRHYATTPYHPQTNGMVERMHAMIGHALTTLSDSHPERWDEYLQ